MFYKKDKKTTTSQYSGLNDWKGIDSELTSKQRLALLAEQALIERMSCLQEIDALHTLLRNNNISTDDIVGWVERSDSILDKLLRYELGKCGKLVRRKIRFMPFSWRRKFRARYTLPV